ncbi:Pre-mRNA-splicing factor 3 [Hesseltinella vesiculosa]|uniref:Pre-mRNA-splicing factor 3 n=1 Tax=Hesseltinella vesiculosa TaxID=101127 RepID=A0A1X2G705_9FUNG|nr:Pre-mRNA-splicing factor 3 [Hesseltinella vesiculosa]
MPSLPTSSSGKIDLRAMLDKGIIPKRDQQLKASRKPSAPAAAAKKVEATPVAKKENPYLSKEALPYHGRSRKTRPMRFVEPGKFVEKAEQQRSKAQLERLKEQVAAKVQQAGMQVDLDISDKALKREQPPVVEWWDAPLLPHQSYDDLPIDPTQLTSLVTSYVHHPVQITPPNENTKPVTRALRLTKTETKKLRRQRRREMLKDKQDKIRLGLLPPDPPKVKISNLMRVLGDEAILDPTKVEAKVRKEMEMRQRMHDEANAARKLTPDERRNKTVAKQKEDQDAGIEAAVFKYGQP